MQKTTRPPVGRIILLCPNTPLAPGSWSHLSQDRTIDTALWSQIPGMIEDSLTEAIRGAGQVFFNLLIWGTYLYRSRRSRATFVR